MADFEHGLLGATVIPTLTIPAMTISAVFPRLNFHHVCLIYTPIGSAAHHQWNNSADIHISNFSLWGFF
jgi:hypothetical protein